MNCLVKEGNFIVFGYTNWKGVTGVRKAIVKEFYFGQNDFHTEYQLFIVGFDLDKLEYRSFAVKDMKEVEVFRV